MWLVCGEQTGMTRPIATKGQVIALLERRCSMEVEREDVRKRTSMPHSNLSLSRLDLRHSDQSQLGKHDAKPGRVHVLHIKCFRQHDFSLLRPRAILGSHSIKEGGGRVSGPLCLSYHISSRWYPEHILCVVQECTGDQRRYRQNIRNRAGSCLSVPIIVTGAMTKGPSTASESETFGQDVSFKLEQPVGSMSISP